MSEVDQLSVVRHQAMQASFGERLAMKEHKILNGMLKRLNSKENPLTEQDAMIGLHLINEVRRLQKDMARETDKAAQELENATRE